MPRETRCYFNAAARGVSPDPERGLTYAIRTDARHATAILKKNLQEHLLERGATSGKLNHYIERIVHDAYRQWGHNVLKVIADCLDYGRYGIDDPQDKFLNVEFFDAKTLAAAAVDNADALARDAGGDDGAVVPAAYISLDDMIEGQGGNWGEISFSRLFSIRGDKQFGYHGRPGKKAIDDQIRDVSDLLKDMKARHGAPVPFVLMEDNVRHAKMLNWVIELMEKSDIFEHGRIAGISTCFCCAAKGEREALSHDGKTIPLAMAVDYGDKKVDVVTLRDLIFDGFVVQLDDKTTRLPGLFMDVERLFKIDSFKTEQFRRDIARENQKFFRNIEDACAVKIPLSWITGADAISYVTGAPVTTRIIDLSIH